MSGIIIYGDPHGDWQPLLKACADECPIGIVILGDCDLVRPIRQELAEIFEGGVFVWFIYGNHEKDSSAYWDNLVGNHPSGSLHAVVHKVGSFDVAGIGGVFKQRIWLPPAAPLFETRAALLRRLKHQERWRLGISLRQRDAIFPEDFETLSRSRADILVTHEAPSSHQMGFRVIDDLARQMRVRLVVHGHHHTSSIGTTVDGIKVIGLAKAEVLRIHSEDLP